MGNSSGKYLLVGKKRLLHTSSHVVPKIPPLYICTLLKLFHRHLFFIIVPLPSRMSEIFLLTANSLRKAIFIFFTVFLTTKIYLLEKKKLTYDLFPWKKLNIPYVPPPLQIP